MICVERPPRVHAYHLLEFDTSLFGFNVARIDSRIDAMQLESTLPELRREGVRLAYWLMDASADGELRHRAVTLGGRLVDEKTTFFMDLDPAEHVDSPLATPLKPDEAFACGDALESLAVQAGEYSRFAVDPLVPRDKFIDLYTLWMRRSISGEIADCVLVIREEQNAIAGMVTLGQKRGRGDIGLIAVHEACRGRKYGQHLVRAAQQWFRDHGYRQSQVVTQGVNLPACNLYHKCGYRIEKVEACFHFWL